MDKIKSIIESDTWWYIARIFWCALPIAIILSRFNIFEVFLFVVGAAMVLSISHEAISAEIKHALESGHINIQSNVMFKVGDKVKKIDHEGNFTEVADPQK